MLLFLFVILEKLLGRKDLGAKGAISLGETTLVSIWSDGQFQLIWFGVAFPLSNSQ